MPAPAHFACRRLIGIVLAGASGIAIALGAAAAQAACTPLRFAYTTQNIPPYYLGDGSAEASPPGAAVELVREMSAAVGCGLILSRLPATRLPLLLADGSVDAAPLSKALIGNLDNIVYPLDKNGQADESRALRLHTVIFVRAGDKLNLGGEPAQLMRGRRLGTTKGAPYAAVLRQAGFEVDDGAPGTVRNLEKLLLRRIDGFAISLIDPSDMDAVVAARFGDDIVRIDKPLRSAIVLLMVNKGYYERNRDHVDAMWSWLGTNGKIRFSQLLKKYDKDQAGNGNDSY